MSAPEAALPEVSAMTQNRESVRRRQRRRAMYGWIFLAPFMLLFILSFVVPIIVSIYRSFFQKKAGDDCGPYGCAEGYQETFVGLQNYTATITEVQFWKGMGRVFLFGIVQIPIMILLALALALLLDSLAAHFQKVYRLTYFLPFAIPGVVAAIIWIYLYTPDVSPIQDLLRLMGVNANFFNHSVVLWSMANVTTWTYTGYNMLIFYAALQSVPTDIYEAARIDGASEWQVTRAIKVPLLSSAALLAVLLSIIGTIQLFNEPAMFEKVAGLPGSYVPMLMAINVKNGGVTLQGASGDGPAAAISIVMALIAGLMALGYAYIQRKVAK